MRTTIDIDDPILKEIKELQRREGKSLGRLVSDLLAQSLADAREAPKSALQSRWIAKPMGVVKLYTHDRDFRKFLFLDVRHPLA